MAKVTVTSKVNVKRERDGGGHGGGGGDIHVCMYD